jgi:hypothetical protein
MDTNFSSNYTKYTYKQESYIDKSASTKRSLKLTNDVN